MVGTYIKITVCNMTFVTREVINIFSLVLHLNVSHTSAIACMYFFTVFVYGLFNVVLWFLVKGN